MTSKEVEPRDETYPFGTIGDDPSGEAGRLQIVAGNPRWESIQRYYQEHGTSLEAMIRNHATRIRVKRLREDEFIFDFGAHYYDSAAKKVVRLDAALEVHQTRDEDEDAKEFEGKVNLFLALAWVSKNRSQNLSVT